MHIIKTCLYKTASNADKILTTLARKAMHITVTQGSLLITKGISKEGLNIYWDDGTYLKLQDGNIVYGSHDCVNYHWPKEQAIVEWYIVDDIKDVPRPYYIKDGSDHMLRYYIVLPELVNFIEEAFAYLIFIALPERSPEKRREGEVLTVDVKGDLAQRWLMYIYKMTNLQIRYI
ncbi:MAG: hypothetical protein QXM92_02440 [Candidatus Anstonellales archaeon]